MLMGRTSRLLTLTVTLVPVVLLVVACGTTALTSDEGSPAGPEATTGPSSSAYSAGITAAVNVGPSTSFFRGLSGPGYVAYKMQTVKDGETTVVVVGVRVVVGEDQVTYGAIYDHALSLAREYGIATDRGERLRIVLVEATSEQREIESKELDPSDEPS